MDKVLLDFDAVDLGRAIVSYTRAADELNRLMDASAQEQTYAFDAFDDARLVLAELLLDAYNKYDREIVTND
jgi:hypothetical protein